jgi:hypothetical protein
MTPAEQHEERVLEVLRAIFVGVWVLVLLIFVSFLLLIPTIKDVQP